jgi:hypothetical protein
MEKRWMPAEGIQSFSGEPETSRNMGHRGVKRSRPRFSQRTGALRPLRTAGSARAGVTSDPTMNRASGTRKGTDVSWAPDRTRPAPSFPGTAGSACVRSSPLDDLEVPSSMLPSRSGDRTGASRHGLSSRPTATGTRVGRTGPRPFREPDQGPIDRSAGRLADGPSASGCRGWPGPDAMGSVSSARVRAAGGRRGRPWRRSSERASADTGHNFR